MIPENRALGPDFLIGKPFSSILGSVRFYTRSFNANIASPFLVFNT